MAAPNEHKKEWFYLDSGGVEQGPFSLFEMRTWWIGKLFPVDLQVRLNREYKFHSLRTREDYVLFKDPNDTSDNQAPTHDEPPSESAISEPSLPTITPPVVEYKEYAIKGRFNNKTGRWESKLASEPEDRALRQMSYYFDLDQYQRVKSGEEKAPKPKRKAPSTSGPAPKSASKKKKEAKTERKSRLEIRNI